MMTKLQPGASGGAKITGEEGTSTGQAPGKLIKSASTNAQSPMHLWITQAQMDKLQFLYLDESTVTDTDLSRLKAFTNLWSLSLKGTRITDAGLEHLQAMIRLSNLQLSRTDVTDAGLARLKDFNRLRTVGLDGTQVTDAGVRELEKALPNLNVKR